MNKILVPSLGVFVTLTCCSTPAPMAIEPGSDAASDSGSSDTGTGLADGSIPAEAGSVDAGSTPPDASVSCAAVQAVTVANFAGSGVSADVVTPTGFNPSRDPTVVFSHGNKSEPSQYACWSELLAKLCIRTVSPMLTNTTSSEGDFVARQARWTEISAVYTGVRTDTPSTRIVFAGHSFGAYTTLLAAGADRRIGSETAGNCTASGCQALAAAGYVVISGQPAASARNPVPFWFAPTAFSALAPGRYVTFGSVDSSPNDVCLDDRPPMCRNDSYTSAAENTSDIVPDFRHIDFACGARWRTTHAKPAAMEALVGRVGVWVRSRTR